MFAGRLLSGSPLPYVRLFVFLFDWIIFDVVLTWDYIGFFRLNLPRFHPTVETIITWPHIADFIQGCQHLKSSRHLTTCELFE